MIPIKLEIGNSSPQFIVQSITPPQMGSSASEVILPQGNTYVANNFTKYPVTITGASKILIKALITYGGKCNLFYPGKATSIMDECEWKLQDVYLKASSDVNNGVIELIYLHCTMHAKP